MPGDSQNTVEDSGLTELLNLELRRQQRLRTSQNILPRHWDLLSPIRSDTTSLNPAQRQYLEENDVVLKFLDGLSDDYFERHYNLMTGLHRSVEQTMKSHFDVKEEAQTRTIFGVISLTRRTKTPWYGRVLRADMCAAVRPDIFARPVIQVCRDESATLDELRALKELGKRFANDMGASVLQYVGRAVVVAAESAAIHRFRDTLSSRSNTEVVKGLDDYYKRSYVPSDLKIVIAQAKLVMPRATAQ